MRSLTANTFISNSTLDLSFTYFFSKISDVLDFLYGIFLIISSTFFGLIWDIYGTNQVDIWDSSGIVLGHIQDQSVTFIGHIWDISGPSLELNRHLAMIKY